MTSAPALMAILAMGLTTYATRIGGFWLAQRLRPSPFVEALLAAMPGAVFMALVAPMVVASGPLGWLAAIVGFVVMRATGQFLLALIAAMAAYLGLGAIAG